MAIILDGSTGVTTPSVNSTSNLISTVLSSPTSLSFQTNGNTTAVTIDTSQNVGIGATGSTFKLAVDSGSSGQLSNFNSTNASGGYFRFQNSGTSVADIGTAAQIVSGSATDFGMNARSSGSLVFGTGNTERMRIDSSGNVGIGTSSPTARLHLSTASGSTAITMSTNNNQNGNATLYNDATYFGIASNFGSTGVKVKFALQTPDNAMTLDASGNLLVGTTSVSTISGEATAKAQVAGNFIVGNAVAATNLTMTLNGVVSKAGRIAFAESGGIKWLIGNGAASENGVFEVYSNTVGTGVQLGRSATAWTAASDERIKDIIEPITNATNKVATLRAVIGKYKTDESGTRRSFLIAQDVQAVLPEAVDDINPDKLGVRYTEVIPLLVAAIQELKAINDTQAETINALTARIEALENK
jgi:hypothetical protein